MCKTTRKRLAWKVDGVVICNTCFLDWSENVYDITDHRVYRITTDEKAFEDSSRRHREMVVNAAI